MPSPRTSVNSATGIMGVTGSGKSSLAATYARWMFRKYKKILLYYSSDGGGFPAEVQACIAAGLIRVFRMYTRDPGDLGLSFETCQRACQGWWPRRINPATGEVPPGVEMVPPIISRYDVFCPKGHKVLSVPVQGLIQPTVCPECRTPVTTADMTIQQVSVQNKGFEDVGGVFYDGLSSMLAWELREMGHRAGRLELKGEESSIGGKVVSGDLKFGGSTRSHVGFVQARGEELVHLTLGIQNLVAPPVFTMLTHEDVDERSLSIVGPKISGRAKTDEAPQWFGNMLEAAKVPSLTGNAGEQRVLYLSEFTDVRGVRHLCKHRGSPGTMPSFLADDPRGEVEPAYAFVQFNLGMFFDLLDGALEKRIADVQAEFPDAPGLPDGMVEIGSPVLTAPRTPTVTASGPQTVTTPQPMGAPATPAVAVVRGGRKRVNTTPLAAPQPPPAVVTPVPQVPSTPPETPSVPPISPAETAPPPQAVATPVPAELPASPTPVPTSVMSSAAPVQASPVPARTTGVAPPPGRRPAPPAVPGATPGSPAGAGVSGPARPMAVSPRPPGSAPRPPIGVPRPGAGTSHT